MRSYNGVNALCSNKKPRFDSCTIVATIRDLMGAALTLRRGTHNDEEEEKNGGEGYQMN